MGGYLSLRERIQNALQFQRKEKQDFWALNDISFSVQRGESIGIIGRNGAGKSTLLKVLSRITPPTKGRIVSRGRIASLLEVGTGFHPELTGRENIFFNGSLLGMKRREIESRFDAIVDFSGVEKFLDTPLKQYSSGMQLRLAFAVAAFLEPEILIIDEVLAVGDVEFQKKCLGKMEDVTKSGRTILFVSHNLHSISTLCSRGIVMDHGAVSFAGDIQTSISTYMDKVNNVHKNNRVTDSHLNEFLQIKDFHLSNAEITSLSGLEFSIHLVSQALNPILGLALLFFNSYQERVAIIDLRSEELFSTSRASREVIVKGKISDLPFIEDNYQVGLYIESNLCTGDFLNLLSLTVSGASANSTIVSYPVQVRGFMELKSKFEINGR